MLTTLTIKILLLYEEKILRFFLLSLFIYKNVMRNIGLKYTELIAFLKIEETKPYFQYEKYVN